MKIIDPHVHMIARTTADYERMALMHTVACCEPAFWAGYDRTSAAAFHDYFTHITQCEPLRAAKYLIQHYAWIGMNSKEAENVALAKEVIGIIPEFLSAPNVLGIGEIGLNKNTRNELQVFELQLELAARHDQMLLFHTPHMDDKLKGTKMMLAAVKAHGGLRPERICFDHVEEHTMGLVLDAGHWAAMTIYPVTKNSPARVVDCIERFGLERTLVDTSGDWGPSDPGLLHQAVFEMRRRGYSDDVVETLVYDNPCRFLGQNPKFKLKPRS